MTHLGSNQSLRSLRISVQRASHMSFEIIFENVPHAYLIKSK